MGHWQIQVRGRWGSTSGGWRPAITGTLNQTGKDDASASTFESEEEAIAALLGTIPAEIGDELTLGSTGEWAVVGYGDKTVSGPFFRVIELDSFRGFGRT